MLYADDITLMSLTVLGLQEMFNVCCESSCELRLQFSAEKFQCIAFGKTTSRCESSYVVKL